MSANPNLPILEAMRRYRGVCEIPGPKSNKLIQGWIKQAASWLDGNDSKTAWCGCVRGSIGLDTGTGVPKEHYRARNWMMWGKPVEHKAPRMWLPGDTIIMKRPGGFHVTLFERITPAGIVCLGGNQGDAVKESTFDLADIIGVRRASA